MASADKTTASKGPVRVAAVVCAIVLACAALYFASSVFAPLAFALFILAIVWPLQERLERSVSRGLALFITLTVTVIVMVMFVSMVAWALSAVGDWLLKNVQRFQAIYVQATDWLEGHGIFVAGTLAERFDVLWLLRLFKDIAWRINRLAGFGILVFVFLMMALLEVRQFGAKLAALPSGDKLAHASVEIAAKFRRYMLVRTLLSILTGLLVWGFAALAGLEPAIAWGLLAFALNYIPFIGPFVATLLPAVFAVAQLDTWTAVIVVFIGLTAIQFLIGNYLEPLAAGAALSISPLAVVFAVFFWGLLWGIPGALIGVPITLTIMAIAAEYPSSRWVSRLLSGAPPDSKKKP
ncbi:MAG TPA: AI-2E family transporter [Methyloceanibacter sp.]|jgi:predicted PurR-regulated permease PerM|nr:AI-2E family transporter [Methyloceanibacter sp.]